MPSLESRWVCRYPSIQRQGLSGWQGRSSIPGGSRKAPTFPQAGHEQHGLPHEVIAGGAVVVLHEAQQLQVWCLQLEAQHPVSAQAEACAWEVVLLPWPPWPPEPPQMQGPV